MTRIETLLDEGKFEEAERRINKLSENRDATVIYDADTTKADFERERLEQDLHADLIINPRFNADLGVIGMPRQAGGRVGPRGEIALVGERGPEIVALPGGAQVYSHPQTLRMLAGGTGASFPFAISQQPIVVHQTFNTAVMGDPFAVMQVVEDANRRTLRLMPVHP